MPYITAAEEEYKKVNPGKDLPTANGIDKARQAYAYYPKACGEKSCKFMLVLHGCGGRAENFAKSYTPIAADNDIVMVFP